MTFNRLMLAAAASLLTLSACVSRSYEPGPDCSQLLPDSSSTDRSWIRSDQDIYLARDGKIFQTRFNAEALEPLADHGFDHISSFDLSPDSAYIAYEGLRSSEFVSYVYDLRRRRDEEIGGRIRTSFSPDGKSLAWIADERAARGRKIVIRELETGETKRVDYPLEADISDYRMTDVAWSKDSRFLYLGTIAYPVGRYARYDTRLDQLAPIEGRYHPFHDARDVPDAGMHFIESGHEVDVFRPACLQWQCAGQGVPMAGVSAAIDRKYRLVVTMPSGERLIVAQGDENHCEGVTIRILSWAGGGRYLVYQLRGSVYIYGVDERRAATLFKDAGVEFGWDDRDGRQSMPAY